MKRAAAVLAILLGSPAARADALDVSGSLGGGYSRSDNWSPDGLHSGSHTWDGEASLTLTGSPFRPGLLDWLLAGDYRDQKTVYDEADSRTRVIGGRAGLSLFGGTVLPVTLGASRTWSDFFSDVQGRRTGGNVVTSLSGTAVLQPRRLPSLRASVGHNEIESRPPGGASTSADSTRLALGVSQSLATHDYSLEYSTGWDHGTYAQNNYRSHTLLLNYSGGTTDSALLHLTERYYLRVPTVADRANPRLDDNNLAAGVQWQAGKSGNCNFSYGYRHLVLRSEGSPELEQLAHRVSQRVFLPVSQSLSLQGNVELSYGLSRRDDVKRRSAGQSTGGSFSLRHIGRTVTLFLSGEGSFGLVTPEIGDMSVMASAGGSTGLTAGGPRSSGHVTYSASYQTGGVDLSGWTVQQRFEVGGDAAPGRRLRLRASLSLAAARRHDDLLGDSLNRSATLGLTAAWPRSGAQLTAGVTESGAGLVGEVPFDDLLLIPRDYNAQTYFATLTASRTFWDGHLVVSAVARTLDVVLPDRPEQWEHGAGLTIGYVIGLVTLSLDDRVSVGGSNGTSRTANVLYLRLTRTFGGKVF